MAWDTEDTKRKILKAAMSEFAKYGPDGTTIEKIAKSSGVNKERIYNYFGNKHTLFGTILCNEMALVAQAMPIKSFTVDEIAEYAGQIYDYHCEHTELSRLMRWEGLVFEGEVPDEILRREYYGHKVQSIFNAQQNGTITQALDADHLIFLIIALAGWWSAVPQVARMFTGKECPAEHARRRASVIEAARRLATVP